MATAEKVAVVEEVADKLRRGQAVIVTDYRGLDVKNMTTLRAKLRAAGVEFQVVKNTLALRAANQVDLGSALEPVLAGPTAIAFGYDDPVAAAKVLAEFAKGNDKLVIKGGVLDGKFIDALGVQSLADLPPREVLIAQVLRGMQGPISGLANVLQGTIRQLVYAVEAVRKQREEAGAA